MKNQNLFIFALVIGGLMLLGLASRIWLVDWPNFKPVFAIGMFLGFFCQNRWVGLLATASMLLLSDAILGFYSLPLMACVYGSGLIAIVLGNRLRVQLTGNSSRLSKIGCYFGTVFAGSLTFFLLTNTAVCLFTPWYPVTFAGLLQSLFAGIPFFKFTLAGDLLFSGLLFSGYYAVSAAIGHFRPGYFANPACKHAMAAIKSV